MITGLVELEFYKLALGLGYIYEDAFYNANINLAVAQFQYFQPDAAIRHTKHERKDETTNTMETVVSYPDLWTSWDKLVVDQGDLTVQEFVDLFPKLFWSVQIELLHKAGKMEKGRLIYNGSETIRSTKTQQQQLQRPNISETLKQDLQNQINQTEQWNANVKKVEILN